MAFYYLILHTKFGRTKKTNLEEANFYGANWKWASLSESYIKNTVLADTNLTPYQIKSACNWEEGIYKMIYSIDDKRGLVVDKNKKANDDYIKCLKWDKQSDPQVPPDCSHWNN